MVSVFIYFSASRSVLIFADVIINLYAELIYGTFNGDSDGLVSQ